MRYCADNCWWGRGLYFAEESSYSVAPRYCHKTKNNQYQILVCRVLIGESHDYGALKQPQLTHPPKKPNSK